MSHYFEVFKKFIRELLSDKLRILSFSFGIIPWIKDWEEILQGYFAYLFEICIAFALLFVGLIAHYIFIKKRKISSESSLESNKSFDFIPTGNQETNFIQFQKVSREAISTERRSNGIFWRFLTIVFISFLVFTSSSFIFLRNATVYYVKIGYYKSERQSNSKAVKINKIFDQYPEYNLKAMTKRRSSREQKLNYLLCINGGIISEKEAKTVKKIASKILPNVNLSIGGSKNIPLIRKIQYLSGHVKRNMLDQ